MHLQKEIIVRSAIEILDRDGLEGVTLRRLAKVLDAQAGSIYYHLANKKELLDEMANAILEEHFNGIDLEDDQRDWAERLGTLARELRAAMLAHRDGARVVAGANLNIAVCLKRLFDLSVRILRQAGFEDSQIGVITVTVTNFTFGYAIEEQSFPHFTPQTGAPLESPRIVNEFPAFGSAVEVWLKEDSDAHFDTCLRIILSGARAELQPSVA